MKTKILLISISEFQSNFSKLNLMEWNEIDQNKLCLLHSMLAAPINLICRWFKQTESNFITGNEIDEVWFAAIRLMKPAWMQPASTN